MYKPIFAVFLALIGSHGAAAAASCTLPDVADKVELKQVPGSSLVTVPVAINGSPKRFLLDIGTSPTRISQAAVADLGLPEATKLSTPILFDTPNLGVANSRQANLPVYEAKGGARLESMRARVHIGSFTIGDATGKNLTFMVAKDSELGKAAPFDGRLTNDFFRQYDVEMDFGTMQMTWLTPTSCTDPDRVAYWSHGGVAVVPMMMADGKIRVPVTIEGHSIIAVIDTSSEHTIMRRDVAELTLGLKADTPGMKPKGGSEGALKDAMGQPVFSHTFPKIAFSGVGGVTAANVPVIIQSNAMASDRELTLGSKASTTDERIPDLVLGMDVLHQLHLYAVFEQQRLYITQVFFS